MRLITGEIKARFDVAAATAYNTLLEICADKCAPASARISAAQEILNRSPLGPVPSRSMTVTARVGVEELLDKLDVYQKGLAVEQAAVIVAEADAPYDAEEEAPPG